MLLDKTIKSIESDLESLSCQPSDYKIIVRSKRKSCIPDRLFVFYVKAEFEGEDCESILEELEQRGYEILSVEKAKDKIIVCVVLSHACLVD